MYCLTFYVKDVRAFFYEKSDNTIIQLGMNGTLNRDDECYVEVLKK